MIYDCHRMSQHIELVLQAGCQDVGWSDSRKVGDVRSARAWAYKSFYIPIVRAFREPVGGAS